VAQLSNPAVVWSFPPGAAVGGPSSAPSYVREEVGMQRSCSAPEVASAHRGAGAAPQHLDLSHGQSTPAIGPGVLERASTTAAGETLPAEEARNPFSELRQWGLGEPARKVLLRWARNHLLQDRDRLDEGMAGVRSPSYAACDGVSDGMSSVEPSSGSGVASGAGAGVAAKLPARVVVHADQVAALTTGLALEQLWLQTLADDAGRGERRSSVSPRRAVPHRLLDQYHQSRVREALRAESPDLCAVAERQAVAALHCVCLGRDMKRGAAHRMTCAGLSLLTRWWLWWCASGHASRSSPGTSTDDVGPLACETVLRQAWSAATAVGWVLDLSAHSASDTAAGFGAEDSADSFVEHAALLLHAAGALTVAEDDLFAARMHMLIHAGLFVVRSWVAVPTVPGGDPAAHLRRFRELRERLQLGIGSAL